MLMEKEKMPVMGEMPDQVIGISHYWRRLGNDLLGVPRGEPVSSLSCYLSGHRLFITLLVE